MQYQGYAGMVDFDDETDIFPGEAIGCLSAALTSAWKPHLPALDLKKAINL